MASAPIGKLKAKIDPNATAKANAAAWNAPGGGYDQFKQGDAQREKDLPIGGMAPQGATAGNYDSSAATNNALSEHPLKAAFGRPKKRS